MAGPYDLTGQNIENTYQRVLQTPNGTTFYDGTGSLVTLTATAVAGGSNTQVQFNSASLLSGSSNFSFDYVNNNILLTGSLLVTQSHISTVDYIDFTILPSPPGFNTGRLHWTDDTKTLQIDTDINNFEIELGHQNVVRGRNVTGYTLTKGTIVYINGESGNRPTFTTASWEGDPSSASTLGFIAQDINDSQTGYVVTNGILRGINTNAYTPGTQLYLSSSGQYTSIVPISPNNEVRLGKTITQATNGYIYVDIMNGYELGELHDVLIVSQSTGDLLMWNSGSKVWVNTKTLSGSYSLSGSLTTNGGLSVQSLTASFISASNITGSLFGTASYIPVGGSDQQIQFNSGSTFGGHNNFVFVYTSASLQQGRDVIATGLYSHAEGYLTQTANDYCHAEGSNTQAIGAASHAEGRSTVSLGDFSHAEGVNTQTIGVYSHAEGADSQTIAAYTHAEGANTIAGLLGYGQDNALGMTSGVLFIDASYGDVSAQFNQTHVVIESADLGGTFYLELDNTNPPYFDGINTILTLVDTTLNTTAFKVGIPDNGQPLGANLNIGGYSHAEGSSTQTYGKASHASGERTVAVQDYQSVVGRYNLQDNGALFVIGNGDSVTRSNLFVATGSIVQITGSLNVTGSEIVIQTDYFGVLNGNTNASLIEATPGAGVYIWSVNANPSADFENRQLIKSDGTTVTVDWENGIFTGSLNGSSSYASTASYVNGNITKANIAAAGTFGGIPLTASITFTTAFPNTNYSIVITGEDARTFTVQNKLAGGFEINTNSSITLTGNTYWQAVSYGEFNS